MRIAWFSHRYAPCIGGAENYSRAMVRRFVGAGHEVDVFTSDAHDLWYFTDKSHRKVEGPLESVVDGARVRRFPVRHYPLQRYFGRLLSYAPHWPTQCVAESYMPILPGIGRVRGAYDAVFGVGFPFTVFSHAAFRTARAAGAPLLLTPFLHLATPGDKVNRAYTRPHQIRLLKEADTVITPTRMEADAIHAWGVPRGRLLTMGMAIDHARVTGGDPRRLRDRLGIPDGAPVVGQLGALDPNKGTVDLVRSVGKLNEARPTDDPIHLILAGAPSPDFETFASGLPESSGRWLRVLGPLPRGHEAEFYAAIDLFAMPSRTDSFGIVFLEAWANGKPVVAAAAGGVVEVVEHDRTGLLVSFGDLNELSRAIGGLIDDPERAQALGEAGRRLVSHGYTWDDRYATLERRTLGLIGPRPKGLGVAG